MEQVGVERHGAVVVFRLNRPPANAFDLEFAREVEAAFVPLLDASEVGALVISGTGDYFSAGLDLKRVPLYGPEEQRAMVSTANGLLAKLYACSIPVVAAVNGHAIAAGLVLALACDYRVGSSAPCKLGVTEVRVGIPFPAVAMAVLQHEVAPHVARSMILRGNNIDPQTAIARGLLDELQPPERVATTAIDVARDLAGMPREAYARIKRQLRAKAIASIEETVASGGDPALESWITADAPAASAAQLRRHGDG